MEAWKEELYHHGILGMKWGVRRYQNKDGSLTEAGKKRYVQSSNNINYTLTKKGKAVEKREFDKLYGKGAFDKQTKQFKEGHNKTINEMSWNESSEALNNLAAMSGKMAIEVSRNHMNLVNSGKLFTKEYFDTKLISLATTSIMLDATSVLKERARLYDEAVKNDKYNIDYMEMAPDPIIEGSREQRLKDYKNYLDDPAKWREERYKH